MKLRIRKLHPAALVPQYASAGAACFDLHATDHRELRACGGTATVPTGLAFEIPEGWCLQVFSRSGHGFKHGVSLVNSVGVIDSDYRGEVLVGLRNDSALRFEVRRGERIAQALLAPAPVCTFDVIELLTLTARGDGGFGWTGVA